LQKLVVKIDGCHPAGFEEDVLTICCGWPGTLFCGDEGANLCEKPSSPLFWDGVHLTEAAYHYIADDWLASLDLPARDSFVLRLHVTKL
jgi:phospholipase/lecithinase/hemolysin